MPPPVAGPDGRTGAHVGFAQTLLPPGVLVDNATLEKLLEVSAPWSVVAANFDDRGHLVEVHIGLRRSSWFGAARTVRSRDARSLSWRHLGLAGRRCLVRLECPARERLPETAWAGPDDSPFTHALAQRLLILFGSGASLAVVSGVMDLDPEEVWRFKHRLDTGRLGANWNPADAPAMPGAATVTARVEKAVSRAVSDLPEAENGVWRELLAGKLSLDIRNLGLQLLLARLRTQFAVARDDDARTLKVLELRRYCEKNITVAAREIAQIRSRAR